MARKLGISSVAEGVESLADWNLVKATGCDIAQGHYLAKAMDEALFLEFCVANARAVTGAKPG
jgi:EAL domain-containing protein (putative c-di-GMP-specific phosphodiesterase class I)